MKMIVKVMEIMEIIVKVVEIIVEIIVTMIKKTRVANNLLKKVIEESKDLLKTNEKNDEDKKYISADELIKKLNARAENDRKINENLKEYNIKEAHKEVEKFNKMITDNLDISREKVK